MRQVLRLIGVGGMIFLQGCALIGFDDNDDKEEVDPIMAVASSIRTRGVSNTPSTADPEEYHEKIRSAVAYRELIPGLEMQQVRTILGEPYDIETAGDAGEGNQRWIYPLGLSGRFGLGSERTLYFEDGKLVGWENRGRR